MPVTLWKTVKPATLAVDAFRLEFLTSMYKVEREMLKDFKETTRTWKHKPKFESIISLIGGPSVLVGTDDQIYNWVSNGTAGPYPIPKVPKTTGFLVYQVGYKAKTQPGVIGSTEGGKFGPKTRRKQVMHPGIQEPREFDKMIKERWEKRFKSMMEDAMKRAAKKSRNYIGV